MKYFFDMDGTICESRQNISFLMLEKLSELKHNIIVISGAERERMVEQLEGLNCSIMAQSGNDTHLWKRTLTDNEKKNIIAHIRKIIGDISKPDLIDDRGCQISLSLVGHHANIELKKKFDPDGKKRERILKDNPFLNDKLECRIAGTTCLDYTRKDGTKGKNIERFIKAMEWSKKDCIYFGDKLYKGGNDESVIGIIKIVGVANPADLMLKLEQYV